MKYSELEIYLSAPRLNRYLHATGSKTKAARLYKANLRLSRAFHPLLGVLEVSLRNKINDKLSNHFADTDWIINEKNGFMQDPSLTHHDKRTGKLRYERYLQKQVKKAESGVRRTGGTISSGKIIAEQTLGFWTALFEVYYYKILKGQPIRIFSSLPSGYGRKEVLDDLDRIRRFRNRINHNEPICFNNGNVSFAYAENVHRSIKEVLTWLDPKLADWTDDMDNIQVKINDARSHV